ncbi:MAG: hypothetical protein AAFN51_06155 [Pseudomonadota bacterium]
MTVETEDGWNAEGDHDSSVSEENLISMVVSALTKVSAKCKQREMTQMAAIALSDSFKVKISKEHPPTLLLLQSQEVKMEPFRVGPVGFVQCHVFLGYQRPFFLV